MNDHFRFTGENPPPHLWVRYPNWQYALEEETEEGQDETTLRPADNQQTIDDDVAFTAGDALLSNGTSLSALLGVLSGELGWIYVYPDAQRDECWVLRYDVPSSQWVAMNDDWFVQGEGILLVPLEGDGVFPLRVTSRLPLQQTGQSIDMPIEKPS